MRAESPIVCARGELLDRGAVEQPLVRVDAAIQDHLRERRDVVRRGKKPGMPGDAAHGPGVFVVHFAPERAACGNVVSISVGAMSARSVRGGLNMERSIPSGVKDFSLRECVERFAGQRAR